MFSFFLFCFIHSGWTGSSPTSCFCCADQCDKESIELTFWCSLTNNRNSNYNKFCSVNKHSVHETTTIQGFPSSIRCTVFMSFTPRSATWRYHDACERHHIIANMHGQSEAGTKREILCCTLHQIASRAVVCKWVSHDGLPLCSQTSFKLKFQWIFLSFQRYQPCQADCRGEGTTEAQDI